MLQYPNPRNANTKIVNAPQMAESIFEGVLASYTKQVGDHVEIDEELASLETDKIDVAVNAPDSGTVTKLLVHGEKQSLLGKPSSRSMRSKPHQQKI